MCRLVKNLASLNGKFFGLPIPIILIWILVVIILIVGLRILNGKKPCCFGWKKIIIDDFQYLGLLGRCLCNKWFYLSCYRRDAIRLEWRRFYRCQRDQYLFLTAAAVVATGTSLLGDTVVIYSHRLSRATSNQYFSRFGFEL